MCMSEPFVTFWRREEHHLIRLFCDKTMKKEGRNLTFVSNVLLSYSGVSFSVVIWAFLLLQLQIVFAKRKLKDLQTTTKRVSSTASVFNRNATHMQCPGVPPSPRVN